MTIRNEKYLYLNIFLKFLTFSNTFKYFFKCIVSINIYVSRTRVRYKSGRMYIGYGLIYMMIVGCGHASESLAYLLTGAPVRGSSANVASEQHTSFGKVTSTLDKVTARLSWWWAGLGTRERV